MRFFILAIGLCGVASAAILARYGLESGTSPGALAAWRMVVASTVLITVQVFRKREKPIVRADAMRLAVAGLFMAAHFATWIASLQYISVARSTLLVSTVPIWAGLASLFIPKQRPKPIFWIGLLVCAFGAVLITSPFIQGAHAWVGDLLAVLGAISLVPYLLISQAVQERVGTLRAVTWIYSSAAVALLVWVALNHDAGPPATRQAWISILGMAIFAQLIGHTLINHSLRHFTTAQIATSTLVEPVFASLLAWLILAEPVTLVVGCGGLLLLGGIGITLRSEPSDQP